MVDANCAYSLREAIQIAERMERYDVYWFEEPLAPDDYRGHGILARSTAIPIATGENEYTRYGFRDLISHDAAAIFNADAQVLGGITEFMQVAALAAAHGLHIAPHGDQEVHLHLVGAISKRPDRGVLPRDGRRQPRTCLRGEAEIGCGRLPDRARSARAGRHAEF